MPKKLIWILISLILSSISSTPVAHSFDKRKDSAQERTTTLSPGALGIDLLPHPDKPQFDFNNADTTVLTGSVLTKIEQVEMDDRGPYSVELASGISLVDKERKKLIQLEVCYPREAGKFPVIIFSHAPIASARDYRPLGAYWASHGFISIMPTHSDALILNTGKSEKVSVFKLIKLAHTNSKSLASRELDLCKVVDTINRLPDKITNLNGKIDPDRIAISGHHAGSYAASMLGGVNFKKSSSQNSSPSSIKAQLLLMGTNQGLPSINRQSWSSVKIPTMVLNFYTGYKQVDKIRQETRQVMAKAPTQDKYLVSVDARKKKRPTRKRLRKMLKDSNIELITFRPLNLFRKPKEATTLPGENPDQSQEAIDMLELPGADLLKTLGISPLEKNSDDNLRFKFAISASLPFFKACLMDDKEALNSLKNPHEKRYNDDIVVKIDNFN